MMSKNWKLLALMILALFALTGCGDDDDDSSPTIPGGTVLTGDIEATIDGTVVDFSENSAGVEGATPDLRVIAGGDQATGTLVMSLPAAVGTYSMTAPSATSIQLVYNSMPWLSVSGSVTVTASSDTNMEGTFNGVFEDLSNNTLTVTNGTFDVPIALAP